MPYTPTSLYRALRATAMSGWTLAAMLLVAAPAFGQAVEETRRVPIRLDRTDGPAIEREMVLTVVHDGQRGLHPFAVLLHGRPESADRFTGMGQQKYPANARYLAHMGFVVLIPTRVGYGVTGGPDVEYTGPCSAKNFAQGLAPVVSEVRQVLQFAQGLQQVQGSSGIVVGESFGGVAAVAIAASDLPGVVAVVNVAGGDGGSLNHLDEPCRPDQLSAAFAQYGRTNRVPALWMYSRNDRFWGAQYPQQWFDAYSQAGGKGEFVWLPADKNNGHYIFNRNAPAWHPAFERFVQRLKLLPAYPEK